MSATIVKRLSHLDALESESIHIFREVAAEFERSVLLFSGGKDSICLLRLAEKSFRPAKFPFPLLHIDTGHNFPEVIDFRDIRVKELGEQLIVGSVEQAIQSGLVQEQAGSASRNRLQTGVLLDQIARHKFDAVIGGARRDEEKARAKERIFSFRDSFGQWAPKRQRPELWNIYNTRLHSGEHMRVFPLSNWTETDVWLYIQKEHLAVPSIYFSHQRAVVKRDGQLLAYAPVIRPLPHEVPQQLQVRARTVGDITCTGLIESGAASVAEIIEEISVLPTTERGTRADDKFSETAMEDRKIEGYF